MKVLSIEGNPAVARALEAMLAGEGHQFINVVSGKEALERARLEQTDIILQRFDDDGIAFIQQLREKDIRTPLIMLGPVSAVLTVECLDAGADDYQTVPFHLRELLGRMKAVHRRSQIQEPEPLIAGALRLDVQSGRILAHEKPLALTPAEYHILSLFIQSKDRTLSHEELARAYGRELNGTNIVQVFVGHLRRQVASIPDAGVVIDTVRGCGYKLVES